MEEFFRSRVPWSTEPSLKSKAEDVGVDFDDFIQGLRDNKPDDEMALELGVPANVITGLKNHFMRKGLDSIMGQD